MNCSNDSYCMVYSLFSFLVQHSLEQAEKLIKEHEGFITTMDANDEKLSSVLQFAARLVDEGHYAEDKIREKADNLHER